MGSEMFRLSIDETKSSLLSLNEMLQGSLNYYLRLKLEAFPMPPQLSLTPARILEIFKETSKRGAVTRVRLYRVGARLIYAVAHHDSVAFELALRDLLELGKVGTR